MKKFLEGLSLPFFLIIGYLSHVLFLFHTTQRIPNIADSVIIGFLSILYGFSLYMNHIKKPDASKELESRIDELETNLIDLNSHTNDTIQENLDDSVELMKEQMEELKADYEKQIYLLTSKVGAVTLKQNMTPTNSAGTTAKSLGW